jgi:hypothetical protein
MPALQHATAQSAAPDKSSAMINIFLAGAFMPSGAFAPFNFHRLCPKVSRQPKGFGPINKDLGKS